MSGMERKKLGEVCENLDRKRVPISKKKRIEGEIPYYGASGIVDYVKDYLFDEDLLLVSEDGANLLARTYPIAFSVNGKVWVNNHAHVLRFPNLISQRFIEYYLNSIKLDDYVTGMAQPKLNQKSLNSILVPFPPLPEQQKIVTLLDEAFAQIDRAKANIEQNIVNAKELFQSKLNEIFSQRGEGWEEKEWNKVLEIRSGRNQKQVLNPNGKYPILGSAGKVMGYADDYLCEEGTTIIGRKGTINNPMMIKNKFWNVDTAFGLQASELLNKYFLYYFCKSFDFTTMDRGSGRPSLVKKDLLKMIMPVPNLETQEKTVKSLIEIEKYIHEIEKNYQQKLQNLEELKKSLLEKAFSGALTRDSMTAS